MLALLKKQFAQNVTLLPRFINRPLLALNRDRMRIFGQAYREYGSFLQRHRIFYDNRAQLFETVNAAIASVPYYRNHYGVLTVRSVKEFEDRIALIDKDIVLENYDKFINPKIDISAYDLGTTGGTSGKPMTFIAPKDRYVVELATMHSLWANAGFDFQPRAVIRNHRLQKGELYRINPLTREYIFDGFRLNHDYFRKVYQLCHHYKIPFFHCYPSTAYEFCSFLKSERLDTFFIQAFFSGSENILDYQVELIENELGIRFYNWYGHSEKLVLGGYCSANRLYHIEPTYGYFELLDKDGHVIREPGRCGEIVGTSFHNPGMPFIRYRTGDYAELYGYECPDCGRKLPLLKNIQGRWSGARIFNRDGSFVTTTALNLHSELYRHLNGLQYVQERKGELRVLIVKGEGFTVAHEADLLKHFQSKLALDSRIEIQYVDRLLRKSNGKFVQLLSSV